MNLLIDPATGAPRWDAAEMRTQPKEEFALEAARRLLSGKTSLEDLKDQIIDAANVEWRRRGNRSRLNTLNDVKDNIGKSGKDWFFEIQRVSQAPLLLERLVAQEGRGLTALSREAGPIQAQRCKGFSGKGSIIKELVATLEIARRSLSDPRVDHDELIRECQKDLKKYRGLVRAQ